MIIENDTLISIDRNDVINGVLTVPDNVNYIFDDFEITTNVDTIIIPKLKILGNQFLVYENRVKNIIMPEVEIIGDYFLYYNQSLEYIEIPNIKTIGEQFLSFNGKLKYTLNMLNALNGDMLIDNVVVDKNEYIRKESRRINLEKLKIKQL